MTIKFYELPPGEGWEGIARLVSYLISGGPVAIILNEANDRKHLSRRMWELPPSLMVPHGIHGESADEDVDPVVIYPGIEAVRRSIVVLVDPIPVESVRSLDQVVEPVSSDEKDKERRRRRFRTYREAGLDPTYIPWKSWGGSGNDG